MADVGVGVSSFLARSVRRSMVTNSPIRRLALCARRIGIDERNDTRGDGSFFGYYNIYVSRI